MRVGIGETEVKLLSYEGIDNEEELCMAEEQLVVGLVAAGGVERLIA